MGARLLHRLLDAQRLALKLGQAAVALLQRRLRLGLTGAGVFLEGGDVQKRRLDDAIDGDAEGLQRRSDDLSLDLRRSLGGQGVQKF